jgi:hypothetical protein
LPASACEMIAKARRRAISSVRVLAVDGHKDVFLTKTGIVFCATLSLFYVYFRGFRFAAPAGSPDGGTPEGDGRCR